MAWENGSRIKGRHARLHRRHTSVLGPGIHSCFPHLLPASLPPPRSPLPAPLTTAPTFSPLFHSWEVNTTGLPASFKGPLQFRQELRMHVWRDILATSKFSSPSLILESWQNGGCKWEVGACGHGMAKYVGGASPRRDVPNPAQVWNVLGMAVSLLGMPLGCKMS